MRSIYSITPLLGFIVLVASIARPALSAPPAVVVDRVEASVNSSLILLSDVKKFRETVSLRSQLDPLFTGTVVAEKGSKASNSDIVRFLVDEKIILQQFPMGDAEVEQEINQIQSNNKIDRATLKSTLSEQGYAFEDYFDLIRSGASKRTLIDREIRSKVLISDEDVKNYFYNHYSKKSSVPLSYRVAIITIDPSNYKTPVAAREIAERALKSLRAGESFEEVARRTSDDPSAKSGGDLGTMTDDQMSPQIREALKKLKIGEVSDVLGSPSSRFFILRLVDVNSSEQNHFNKVKEEIRNQLLTAEYQHQISLWLDRQRQNAFIHVAGTPAALK